MQYNLFGEKETEFLTTKKAAMLIGVSDATIHNWVKTGYLQTQMNGRISQDSVNEFIENFAGKEKLNARANKLQKDEHNHKLLCEKIEQKLKEKIFNDNLGQEYENLLCESFRNKEGIYYTPANIIIDMLKNIDNTKNDEPRRTEDSAGYRRYIENGLHEGLIPLDAKPSAVIEPPHSLPCAASSQVLNPFANKTFLDPCCGGGNFIIQAIKKGFDVKNVYGFDTDINAVEITKKRIFERTGFVNENIVCGDFLELAKGTALKYDYIFTNPPWGKKLPKEIRDRFSEIYQTGKSIDTSSLFFFACLLLLNEGGKLGFLLPEAFFNISTFEDARKAALNLQIERLIDYGKPFKGLLTRAQAIILKKERAADNLKIKCETENHNVERNQQSFNQIPKHIFNFWADNETYKVIEHIYSLPHITLEDNAKWGLGIVTGNNDKVCKTVRETGFVPIFRGQDITPKKLKGPALFISEDLSNCQQAAPLELYKAREKLIYRFISNKLVFYCDKEQNYILNSANMLVLNKTFPISGQQLSDLFNSDFMNWVFANIFHTHKILRGDLELLPILIDYLIENKTFNEEKYINHINIGKLQNGTYRIKR